MPKIVQKMRRRPVTGQRGFTLLDMLFVLALIGLLSTLALPALTRARGSAQSSAALATLRVVNSAQLSFAITCGLGFYAPDLPALAKVPAFSSHTFIPADLGSAPTVISSGYSFTVTSTPLPGAPPTCNGIAAGQTSPGYAITADPLDPLLAPRYFATNADGVLYEHDATLAGIIPETGQPAAGSPVNK